MSQRGIRRLIFTMISFLSLSSLLWIPSAHAAYTVSGTVFRDYNANGARDLNEPGIADVQVTAYNAAGQVLSVVSNSLGIYSLNIPTDETVRIEFTPSASFVFAGAAGTNNDSSVVFVSAARTLDYGLSIPGDYCQQNPDFATSCYSQGDQQTTATAMLQYKSTSAINPLAQANQIGTTWGLGYQRITDAFLKRYAGFGPGGTGTIYVINNASTATPSASPFLDLNAMFGTGADPHDASINYDADRATFPLVGKLALGDVDVSEDDQTIWTVNLDKRELYRIPIGLAGIAPAQADIGRYIIPSADCPAAADARPFGLGMYNALVYVGVVCSAESTGLTTDLRALIYEFNPQTASFTKVVDIPLNYTRGCVDIDNTIVPAVCPSIPDYNARWRPWVNTLDFAANDLDGYVVYPQPMLTDIVFDNGAMVLGFRDRFGDQSGQAALGLDPADNLTNFTGFAAGDIMRLCPSGSTWTLENNGSCGGVTTAGAGTNQGPGGGEFYFGENHPSHDEIAIGGLAQIAGTNQLASTVYDPINDPARKFESGLLWLDNTTGARQQGVLLRSVADNPFGKANGLGDLEALCNAAPVEIGNRVWLDADKDGVQDSDEPAIADVTVELVNAQGAVIASAVTDSLGHYYFSNNPSRIDTPSSIYNITDLRAGGSYTVRIPLNQAVLNNSFVTVQTNDANPNGTIRDSDGDNSNAPAGTGAAGYTQVNLTVTGIGQNRHTYDFGFSTLPTAIVLSRFSATVQDNGIRLEWVTALETNSFGFALMRSSTGQRTEAALITPTLIPATGRGQGASYTWLDDGAKAGQLYWLIEVETDGKRIEYGPFHIQTSQSGQYRVMLPQIER